jgi:serine/threonine protein kinase
MPTSCLFKPGRVVKFGDRTYKVAGAPIGRGGSGEVYKARQVDRFVALKVFFLFYQPPLFGLTSSRLPQNVKESLEFQRKEYEFLSQLSHPNIVRVYDAGEVPLSKVEQKYVPIKGIVELPAIVMDFIDGSPLKEAIEEFHLSANQLPHAVPLSSRVEKIINTRSFRRLGTINQLCLLNYVYPGADYKR